MKLFIKEVASFILFFVTAYLVIIACILFLNRMSLKNCHLGEKNTTVIAGDSHTMWSIDDRKLNGVRNISLNAEGYFYTYIKLQYLLKQGNEIRKLYLGFSYHNLSGYYDDYIYGRLSLFFFHRYIDILGFKDYLTLFFCNPKIVIRMSPIILRHGIVSLLNRDCTFLGNFPSEVMLKTLNSEKVKKRIQEQYYRNGSVVPFSRINVEYLIKILDLCKKNDIKIIALSTPEQKDYCQLIPHQYIDAYEQFVKEHKLTVYNFNGLVLPDSCYLPDGDHANSNGATVVTEYFSEYIAKENYNDAF
jgi:hypothetical protein